MSLNSLLLSLVLVGILIFPVIVLGAECGGRPNCIECLSEETCNAEFLCFWNGAECENQSVISVSQGDISTAVGHTSGLFDSAKYLILLAMGVPLAFYVITRSIKLTPADRIGGRRGRRVR